MEMAVVLINPSIFIWRVCLVMGPHPEGEIPQGIWYGKECTERALPHTTEAINYAWWLFARCASSCVDTVLPFMHPKMRCVPKEICLFMSWLYFDCSALLIYGAFDIIWVPTYGCQIAWCCQYWFSSFTPFAIPGFCEIHFRSWLGLSIDFSLIRLWHLWPFFVSQKCTRVHEKLLHPLSSRYYILNNKMLYPVTH